MVIVKGPPVVGEMKYRNGRGTASTDAERPNAYNIGTYTTVHWGPMCTWVKHAKRLQRAIFLDSIFNSM